MLTTILASVFVLGVLIFFHELGHFLLAKRAGIRVDKFSLGFPPSIIKKKWGETVYAIGLIPLGGYVRMAGDNPDDKRTGAPWEFMSKSVWKRFTVIIAGPLMNFFLAIFIFTGLFYFRGIEIDKVFIDSVSPDSPAEAAGIMAGDYIISVDGTSVSSFIEMAELIQGKVEEPLEIGWMRDGTQFSKTMTTMKQYAISSDGDTTGTYGVIGVTSGRKYESIGLFPAIWEAVYQTGYIAAKSIEFIGGFFSGKSKASDVGGPIFIAQFAGATARAGIDILLEFMALLSVNLAVLNILPIPVFDGGHIMFLLAEKIKGAPISLKVRLIFQQIGVAFLLFLVIFITFNDITR
jgi:regulator of sigma E protease